MNTYNKENIKDELLQLLKELHTNKYSSMSFKKFLSLCQQDSVIAKHLESFINKRSDELENTYYVETPKKASREDEQIIKDSIPGYSDQTIVFKENPSILAGFNVYKGSYIYQKNVQQLLQTLS